MLALFVVPLIPGIAVFMRGYSPHEIVRQIHSRRIHRLFEWKFWAFVVGGAPLDSELEEFWRRLGFAVIQGYGLTETAPIVAFNNPFHM
jgi:long-subunit acyl-CoA synthetase (AMP-forming)